MPKVEDIKVLNIDGVPYAVDALSDNVKAMVDMYNEWNVKHAEAQDHLLMVQAAKNDLSRQIIMQVRQEQEEEAAEAEAAEEAPAEEAAEAPVEAANEEPAAE